MDEVFVQHPLSRDEQAAMARYIAGVRKQLEDVADLFTARYGSASPVAAAAVKTLEQFASLEREVMRLESELEYEEVKPVESKTGAIRIAAPF